jgi:signal transduction histidine kinase
MPHPAPDPVTRDWALRARRLEALCTLAAETAGMVETEPVAEAVLGSLHGLLGADCALVRLPDEERVRSWAAARDGGPADHLSALLDAAGEGWVELEGGGCALVLSLPAGSGTTGRLGVAWSGIQDDREEIASIAELVVAQTDAALRGVRAYARLTETAYRRERFFSAMSHDLRTPITAIVGYSELLADGIVGELTSRQSEMVERISQVSGHLAQLVNDVLDLARLDAGGMDLHPRDAGMGELVEDALPAVEPQARAKDLELSVSLGSAAGLLVRADPQRVRQILVNLLSNAIKFTPSGAVVVAAGSDAERAWIEVRDTGPGIPAGAEEDVFEEFLQIAAGTRSKGEPGSGLGLAISRRLARAMGGDLTARNVPEAGAVFTLLLPLALDGEADTR